MAGSYLYFVILLNTDLSANGGSARENMEQGQDNVMINSHDSAHQLVFMTVHFHQYRTNAVLLVRLTGHMK